MQIKKIKDCWLINADCMDAFPDLEKVDAVVTDPPYGLGDWNNRGSNKKRKFDSDKTQQWDEAITQEHIDEMIRLSKYQIFWGANYYLDLLKRSKQMLIWNKGIRNMHFNDCEIAWCNQWKEASRMFDLSPAGLQKDHPTQKPLQLMIWCLDQLPNGVKTILDPFMGSGTTGVACIKRGLSFVGIERDPNYYDLACFRIKEAYEQPDLFESSPGKQNIKNIELFEEAS